MKTFKEFLPENRMEASAYKGATNAQRKTMDKLRRVNKNATVWIRHDIKLVSKKDSNTQTVIVNIQDNRSINASIWIAIYPDGSIKKNKVYKKLADRNWILQDDSKMSSAPKKVKIDLRKIARSIEDAVGNTFPDGDPFDYLISHKYEAERAGMELIDLLNKAAKKHLGAKNYHDYLANVWDDYAKDNPEFDQRNPWK